MGKEQNRLERNSKGLLKEAEFGKARCLLNHVETLFSVSKEKVCLRRYVWKEFSFQEKYLKMTAEKNLSKNNAFVVILVIVISEKFHF